MSSSGCIALRSRLRNCAQTRRTAFRFAILISADNATVDVEAFGKQCPVAQPDSVSTAELAAHRGHFHLELAVVVPGPLDARTVNHSVFAQQAALLVPLAANAVRQP